MSAEIINLADARKARQQARAGAGDIFLIPLHVSAFWAEAWLDALSRAGRDFPRWPGGIDDLEV